MSASVRLRGGVSWRSRVRQGEEVDPRPRLLVTVGKSDQLREIPLSDGQLLNLIQTAAEALKRSRDMEAK